MRIVHPEPSDREADALQLPDHLAEMAEQLQLDADRLAEAYPARSGDRLARELAAQVRSRRRRRIGWAAAAALLIAAGSLTWRYSGNDRPAAERESATRPAPPTFVIAPAASPNAESSPTVVTPVVSLHHVSGPELEAVLDLLEKEPDPVVQVAF